MSFGRVVLVGACQAVKALTQKHTLCEARCLTTLDRTCDGIRRPEQPLR